MKVSQLRRLGLKTWPKFTGFSSTFSNSIHTYGPDRLSGPEFAKRHVAPGIGRLTELNLVEGKGSWVWDDKGDKYLDFTCGIGVTNLGHCHPKVTRAVAEQAGKLVHAQVGVSHHDMYLRVVEKLLQIGPSSLDCAFLWNSGSEAVEAAVKVARAATGKTNIINVQGAYHGRTIGTMSLTTSRTGYSVGQHPFMPGVFTIPFPYASQLPCPGRPDGEELSRWCLTQLELLLKQQTAPSDTAALILEPVLGEGGYVAAPASFMEGLGRICKENQILLICDEVQSGYGRTGKMFAVEHYPKVEPDILVFAKGIANGYVLSGILARRELMSKQPPGSMGGTYAGNAVSCAAALAVLEVFEEEQVLSSSPFVSYLRLTSLNRTWSEAWASWTWSWGSFPCSTRFLPLHVLPTGGWVGCGRCISYNILVYT